MNKEDLKRCLDREVDVWSAKNFETLLKELEQTVAYEYGAGDSWYCVDVELLEREPDYVHVMVIVDNKRRPPLLPYRPLSADFLVYRGGRVDK